MKKYWLTGKQAPTPIQPSTLSGGWNTTRLMLTAAQNLAAKSPDQCFTLTDLVTEATRLMWMHHIHFVGKTNFPARYTSPGERVVHGRFGDMRRSGYFTSQPPATLKTIVPLHIKLPAPKPKPIPKPPDAPPLIPGLQPLENTALQALLQHGGRLTEQDLANLLRTRKAAGVMVNLMEKLPANAIRLEDAGPAGNLYILNAPALQAVQ